MCQKGYYLHLDYNDRSYIAESMEGSLSYFRL